MPMNDRTKELLEQLGNGIADLTTSGKWAEYLTFMAKFHRYSFGNVMLILFQKPDATQVMGFGNKAGTSGWKSLGRNVIKGESAIWILAPITKWVDDEDENSGAKHQIVVGWKSVPVFDVSQTEGDPLPEVVSHLQGEAPEGMYANLTQVALSLGITSVTDADLGAANGVTRKDGTVQIHPGRSALQRVKTLVHEIAHWQLGHLKDGEGVDHRGIGELEAESVAYVVLGHLGIDTSDYSFGYVAGWQGNDAEKAQEQIRASAGKIQKAVTKILAGLEDEAAKQETAAEQVAVAA